MITASQTIMTIEGYLMDNPDMILDFDGKEFTIVNIKHEKGNLPCYTVLYKDYNLTLLATQLLTPDNDQDSTNINV
jgi:hypothetical protein